MIHTHRSRFSSIACMLPPIDIMQPLYSIDKELYSDLSSILILSITKTHVVWFGLSGLHEAESLRYSITQKMNRVYTRMNIIHNVTVSWDLASIVSNN